MGKYFDSMPIIDYNGVLVRDITRTVKIPDTISGDPRAFYPYTLVPGQRADSIASAYYDNAYDVWLVYLSNGITDPYYDWYMTDQALIDHVVEKYGSINYAARKIMFYRVNWHADSSRITVAAYGALLQSQKKYWAPLYSQNGNIVYYERRRVDWKANTNRIFSFAWTGTNKLKAGDLVTITVNSIKGFGEVDYVDANKLYIKNVIIGTDILNQSGTIVSDLSDTPQTVTFTDCDYVTDGTNPVGIPIAEAAYWEPVSALDIEVEKNTANASIRLLDKALSNEADEALNRAMNG